MFPKTAPVKTLSMFLMAALLAGSVFAFQPAQPVQAVQQIDIRGTVGSGIAGQFGYTVTVLPGGNIVVTDPYYDAGARQDAGAVFLVNGKTGAILSTFIGSAANDQIGAGGVVALHNGSYVVKSPLWNNGAGAVTWCSGAVGCSGEISLANSLSGAGAGSDIAELKNGSYVVLNQSWHNSAGAVTWCSGTKSCTGEISAANSLVGSSAEDAVGAIILALSNGNYVTGSFFWSSGSAKLAGAVTWCSGSTGCTGAVSAANSLVGSHTEDTVGFTVTELRDGNYAVSSAAWDNGTAQDAGAVTLCSGTAGCRGSVSAANSLVGSHANDYINSIQELSGGGYAIASPSWDNGTVVDAGAVTWCSGISDCKGTISTANSLVGGRAGDQVGTLTDAGGGKYAISSPSWDNGTLTDAGVVTLCSGAANCTGLISAASSLVGSHAGDQVGSFVSGLKNGSYVVISENWANGSAAAAGAVTLCTASAGCPKTITTTNSLVGSHADDRVGSYGITELSGGGFVIVSAAWDSGAVQDVGAVTWCSGTTGCHGAVSSGNSLVGSHADDQVGTPGIVVLANGSYVVESGSWDNGAVLDAGAITRCSGTAGCTGVVSGANSLVGSHASDGVSSVVGLSNGSYIVNSPTWDNGALENAGAVTLCGGTSGCQGEISAANSLVGSSAYDRVGLDAAGLKDGSYVVLSREWDNGLVADAGAVTWCGAGTGCTGSVSASNSLVGSQTEDFVGDGALEVLDSGDYVISSQYWDNGKTVNAGAVTWCSGTKGCQGGITTENSVMGTAYAAEASTMTFVYDAVNIQLVVGRPFDQTVSLFRLYAASAYTYYMPVVFR